MVIFGEALSAMATLKSFLVGFFFFLALSQQEAVNVVLVHHWCE